MEDLEKIRARFPVTRHLVYLNHAAVSPLPAAAADAVSAYLEDVRDYGPLHESRWLGVIEALRERCARLISAQPTDIVFLKSPLSGINMVSSGLELREGDRVVTADMEFPANVYPWIAMVPRGVEVKFVGPRDGRIDPEDVEKAIDAKTKVVAASLVEFGTGLRNNISVYSELCRRRNVPFFLDATQGVGAIPFDAQASGADFIMIGAYKWLLGPQGMGILCCRPDAVERFKGEGSSWRDLAAEDEMAGNRAGARGDARRLETEMPAMMGIAALSGSLAMRDEVGNHVIYSRVRLLAERLMLGLRGLGWNVITPPDPADRAGIVVFSHPAFDSREVMHKLRHLGIMISARNGTLRASPHFYNSEEEIDRLLAELSKEQAGA